MNTRDECEKYTPLSSVIKLNESYFDVKHMWDKQGCDVSDKIIVFAIL